MTKPLLILLLSILIINVYAQSDSTSYHFLEAAYRCEDEGKRDSAIFCFGQAGTLFENQEEWQNYIECLAGENRNYLSTDRIGDVNTKGQEAVKIVDAGKTNEVNLYFIEILYQLSRYNWYAVGNFPESLKFLDRAVKICDQADFDVKKHRLRIFTEYGYTYGYSGEFDLSENNFRNALEMAIEVYGEESEVVADRYTDMVFPLIQKSEWEKAEIALKNAIELNIRIRGPEHRAVLKNYNNLGYIYMEKFDNDQAILYINKAIDMIRKQFGENHRSIGIGYMNIGSSYSNRGDYRTGLQYSKMAIENFKTSIGDKSPYIGICLQNIGNEYNHLEIYDSAEIFYNEALTFKIGLYGKNHHEIVNMYVYLTNFYLKTEDHEQAFAYANEGLEIAATVLPEKHKHFGNSHLGLSQCYAAVRQYEESLQEVQLAIMSLMPDFNDKNPASNPDLNQDIISTRILIEALIHKTQILTEFYHESKDDTYLNIAYQTAIIADKALDMLRNEYQTPDSKEILLSRSEDFYENAIDISLQLYEKSNAYKYLDQAFGFMEKSKSILLIENVRSNDEFALSSLPDSIAIEEKSLSRSIAFYKEQIFEARNQNDSVKLVSLDNDFFQKKRDYDLLLNFIEENYPEYFSIQHAVFNISLENIQKKLPQQTLLVSYFNGTKNIYAIAISKIETILMKIEKGDDLENALNKLIHGYEKRSFDFENAHFVFESLLQPLLTKNKNKEIGEITFLPDGILHYLPFETLVTEIPYPDQPHYLIEKYTINYMHSVSLPQLHQNKHTNDVAYIGFSPTYIIDSNPLLASRSARDVQIASQLEKLPMAEKEIKASAGIWKGDFYIEKNATEENFKKLAGNAGIIHIASHTIIDDDEPMNSKLVFSPGADTLEDGLLHTYELYNMKLQAQLACLSACNTGFGQLKSGEGVVSLAKGFFYAGVPNVMMSLWSVPDISTSEIMTYFYEELKKGAGKADALRNAKLKYLKTADVNTADPYYWAAFTLIGDNEPLEFNNPFRLWIYAIIFLIGIPLLVFAIRKVLK